MLVAVRWKEPAVVAATPSTIDASWLYSRRFDNAFVLGVAALALASGALVVAQPRWFMAVLTADLWLLGYPHVVSTFTRLAFDEQSLRESRFMVFALPLLVFATTFALAWGLGIWVISSVYLYWQWFHYTRQSWGINQVYRAKSGGRVDEGEWLSWCTFYLTPVWGILHRSAQAPETFLFVELRVVPVPQWLATTVGAAAVASILVWGFQRLRAWREGRLPVPHTLYMLSHFTIFFVGYGLIDDITYGWLAINVWHNAQYILFVWLFNAKRFREGIDASAPLLSRMSQPSGVAIYAIVCLGISTALYSLGPLLMENQLVVGLPLVVLFYQAVNFHHYIVDSRIWKVRKAPMRRTLELDRA